MYHTKSGFQLPDIPSLEGGLPPRLRIYTTALQLDTPATCRFYAITFELSCSARDASQRFRPLASGV